VRLDVAGGQAAGVERQDHLVDLPEAPCPLGHDLRLEGAIPVARHVDRDRTVRRGNCLARAAITRVTGAGAGQIVAGVAELVGHLGLQGALDHGLGHLVEQPVDPVDRCPADLRVG
jgi:hypothetical protein